MSEETLLDIERDETPSDVADWLRAFADDLDGTGELTIAGDGHSVTIDRPAETLEFELEVEREPGDDADEIELEIELEWLVPSMSDRIAAVESDDSDHHERDSNEAEESGATETDESESNESDE